MSIRLRPCTIRAACRYVGEHHRHSSVPTGGLFAVAIEDDDQLLGVAIIGRPIARMLDDGFTAEVTRLCTTGTRNGCSMLYGAACRAAKALGYHLIVTYTLASEPGTSLRASGWELVAEVPVRSWAGADHRRGQHNLWGEEASRPQPRRRWAKHLVDFHVVDDD